MSKYDKLLEKFQSNPKDFTWDELKKILSHHGYEEIKTGKTGGSRRKFADKEKNIISLHKPHPANILKTYQINEVITHLVEKGKLTEPEKKDKEGKKEKEND